ncbi:hypothetical protein BH23ACT12_BH23ACT12_07040 [soil metagenome]
MLDPGTNDPQPEPDPEPTQPPTGGNGNTPEETPAPEDGPKTGGGNAGQGANSGKADSSAPGTGQTVAGTESLPVQVDGRQVSETSDGGIPNIVWILLSAILSAAAAFAVSRSGRRKADQI